MKKVCVITARGGSKRIPRKNIRDFLGQPIIAYPILAAIESQLFEMVMVSTDDPEIAEVSMALGAEVPFLRSETTANDYATTADVLLEVLGEFDKRGMEFCFACCCYPASPFVTEETLRLAYQQLEENDVDCVFPVCEYSTPIQRAFTLEGARVRPLWPEEQHRRSQDLSPAYFDTGQFYFFRVQNFLASGSLLTNNTIGLPVPSEECQDIDNEADWKMAELKYKIWTKG